jgi:Putative zinc-finger
MQTGGKPMPSENVHLTDQELLLAIDDEFSVRRAAQVRAHLAHCDDCRKRIIRIEENIADFARIHRQTFDAKLPSIDGPRAQLRAELSELAIQPVVWWRRLFQFNPAMRMAVYICMAVFVTIVGGKHIFERQILRGLNPALIASSDVVIPNRSLTPGATRQVAISDVCSMPHEEVIASVPHSLRQRVFQEYGIVNARTADYEIDYLITPGLGGAEDINNLWPEPYKTPRWNAHVKDALEEYLHQMVCSGKLDLPTAQRDIATNWIAAYKKYFHTDKPLSAEKQPRLLRNEPHFWNMG